MYILYDELFWTDEHGDRKHDCVKTKFETLEEAQDEMNYQFNLRACGNVSSLLLSRSAIIIHYDKYNRYDRMVQFGIIKES